MICIHQGGMRGRIGRFVWFNGSDLQTDQDKNVLQTGGYNRFGAVQWLDPVKHYPALRTLKLKW